MMYKFRLVIIPSMISFLFIVAPLMVWPQDSTVVKISNGYLKGIKDERAFVFKGVPYAKAPTGSLRFKAPEPTENWSDTLICTNFSQPAAQFDAGNKIIKGSEDCLKLNIYTPALKRNA